MGGLAQYFIFLSILLTWTGDARRITRKPCNECDECPNYSRCNANCCSAKRCADNCSSGCSDGSCHSTTEEPPAELVGKKCCYIAWSECSDDGTKCTMQKHRECSAACTSSLILVLKQNCHQVDNEPKKICENTQRIHCGQCYFCNGEYHPTACSKKAECPKACRPNLPTCFPSKLGFYCL